MLNSNLGGGIPGYMGESGVKATSPTDPHLSDPHAAANDLFIIQRFYFCFLRLGTICFSSALALFVFQRFCNLASSCAGPGPTDSHGPRAQGP